MSTSEEPHEAETRPRVQSAARATSILLAIAGSDAGLRPRDISAAVGVSRQTTYHLLHTLGEMGMVTRGEDDRYLLGLRVRRLAAGLRRQLAPAEHLARLVREVARATGETSYAAGWTIDGVSALHVVKGSLPAAPAEVPVGYAEHPHARASGKVLLSLADTPTRQDCLREGELPRLTPNTIVDPAALTEELASIREQGYAVDREELAVGLCCIAIPLDGGRLPFTLGLSAPPQRFHAAEADYLGIVRQVAAGRGKNFL